MTNRFNRTNNRGTKVCKRCGKRTWKALGYEDYCETCTHELEAINAHYDRVHEDPPVGLGPNPEGCPLCREAAEE